MRREWLVRAIRTFVQAALGYAAANVTGLIGEGAGLTKNALAALTVAAVAAGLAALMNVGSGGGKAHADADESVFPCDDSGEEPDGGEGGGADE